MVKSKGGTNTPLLVYNYLKLCYTASLLTFPIFKIKAKSVDGNYIYI